MGADPVGQAEGEPERKWRKKDTKRSAVQQRASGRRKRQALKMEQMI